jgi:hypothetical protein
MKIRDTIHASSVRDAERQIEKLYPDAIDFDFTARKNSAGQNSARGEYFSFTVEVPDDETDYGDELLDVDGELGEDEY